MKQLALAVILRPKGTSEVRTVIFKRHGPSPNRGGFLFITVMICFLTYASKTKTFVCSLVAEGFLANRDTDLSAVFVIQKKAARHVYEQALADAGITAGDLSFLPRLAWVAHCLKWSYFSEQVYV